MAEDPQAEMRTLSQDEMRDRVIELAFGSDPARLQEFVDVIGEAVPQANAVVLRGSAITGVRWKDGAPFDSEGPGTSDLDLTLVGADLLKLFAVTGFWVPGIHTRPLSDDDPD